MTKNHLRTAKQRGKGLGRNLLIGSVARTFKVMEQLAQASGPMSIAALAQVTGRPKSSLHRVLSTLVHTGFVEQDRETGIRQPNLVDTAFSGRTDHRSPVDGGYPAGVMPECLS
jgi:hypothetical protein